jgi:hypothetical protein
MSTVRCRVEGCRHVAHLPCAFPGARVKRSALFSDYKCAECMEFELDIGEDSEGGECLGGVKLTAAMAELMRFADEAEAAAVAPGTHSTVATGITAFDKFWETYMAPSATDMWSQFGETGLGETAAQQHWREGFYKHVRLFAAHTAKRGLKASTTESYVNSVAAKLRTLGVDGERCPARHHRVKRLVQGLKRREGDAGIVARRATALDEELVRLGVRELLAGNVPDVKGTGYMSRFEADQAAIVFLLGFGALPRRSELAGLDLDRWAPDEDGTFTVTWSAPGWRRAKTDKAVPGQQSTVADIVLDTDLRALMVKHTAEVRRRGVAANGGFFRNCGPRAKFVRWAEDGEAVSAVVKRVVKFVIGKYGLKRPPASTYSSHSLRRGGAQYLRDQGVSRELIKLAGRWLSDAVDVYLDDASDETRRAVAREFSGVGGGSGKRRK